MIESKFKQMVERHLQTHKCPRCSAMVYLEQERCPQCGFDLASWRWNRFRGQMKVFTEKADSINEAPSMETYNAVVRIARERPDYLHLLRKCLEAHHRKDNDVYFETLGFESKDVPCQGSVLSNLFRDYPEVVKRVYSSRSSKGYVVVNVPGVERALGDMDSGTLASSTENDVFMRIRFSPSTVDRLRDYATREFPGWDDNMAVWLVVERVIIDFLDRS